MKVKLFVATGLPRDKADVEEFEGRVNEFLERVQVKKLFCDTVSVTQYHLSSGGDYPQSLCPSTTIAIFYDEKQVL